ncbi:hypothetical protein L596_011917 [Steinernema carpocapsae]|uniref:Uncharacterized protein n=1 Tax=Steinernema carpocapsae TaxID=34508 RepID=A0A4U5NVQ9_STECR|nr:hypothetical protein L596_011917 [Steinernema carpocapsae]
MIPAQEQGQFEYGRVTPCPERVTPPLVRDSQVPHLTALITKIEKLKEVEENLDFSCLHYYHLKEQLDLFINYSDWINVEEIAASLRKEKYEYKKLGDKRARLANEILDDLKVSCEPSSPLPYPPIRRLSGPSVQISESAI